MTVLALWLADVLHEAGLNVVEQPGWTLRGRPMEAIEGTVTHHTASPIGSRIEVDLAVCTNGTNGTPGPISQILIARDATVYVIAAGKANHAGAGGPIPGWLPESPPGQLSVANARTIGLECVNNGIGEAWSPWLLDAMEIANAAILAHIDVDESRALTHQEWAPRRKIDPAGPTAGRVATLPGRSTWDPNAWRARIAERLQPAPAPEPPPEEDDMCKPIFIGVEGSPGQYLYYGAGTMPLAFTDPTQRDLMLAAYGLDPKGTTISPEMFARMIDVA